MHVVHVHVHVKPESVEAFERATAENASNSVKEPGVARFDVVQRSDDPSRFILIEEYRSAESAADHKKTAHYLKWRDAVAGMMAEPRTGIPYRYVYPPDAE